MPPPTARAIASRRRVGRQRQDEDEDEDEDKCMEVDQAVCRKRNRSAAGCIQEEPKEEDMH